MVISSHIAVIPSGLQAPAIARGVMASEPSVREPEPAERPAAAPETVGARQNGEAEPHAAASGAEAKAPERDESSANAASDPFAFTPEELRLVQKLRQRDLEVRAHEQAHVAAGGQYVTSGPSYDYQTGPDGRRYAIGGEVGIDTSPIPGDPEATAEKARVLMRAALAPAEPSSQDQRVAAAARSMEVEASADLLEQQREERAQEAAEVRETAEERQLAGADPSGRVKAVAPMEGATSGPALGDAQESAMVRSTGRDGAGAGIGARIDMTPTARALFEARERLETRIAGFFAPLESTRQLSRFA